MKLWSLCFAWYLIPASKRFGGSDKDGRSEEENGIISISSATRFNSIFYQERELRDKASEYNENLVRAFVSLTGPPQLIPTSIIGSDRWLPSVTRNSYVLS